MRRATLPLLVMGAAGLLLRSNRASASPYVPTLQPPQPRPGPPMPPTPQPPPSSWKPVPPNQGPPIGSGPPNLERERVAPIGGWTGGRALLAADLAPESSWLASPEGVLGPSSRAPGASWFTRDRIAVEKWLPEGKLFVAGWSTVTLRRGARELRVMAANSPVMLQDIRLSCSVLAAQCIADANQATLPTTAIMDAIWAAHAVLLNPEDPHNPQTLLNSYAQSVNMQSICAWLFEEDQIAAQLARVSPAPAGLLPAGIIQTQGKVYVLDPLLATRPPFCPMYGWHRINGAPIQGVNPDAHGASYFDYSHSVQLVQLRCTYNGQPANLLDVYRTDPDLASMGRTQSPIPTRYPLVPLVSSGGGVQV